MYQPWFKPASQPLGVDDVPCGGDSFFRQLDFMIATVANERFRKLYATDDVAAYAEPGAARQLPEGGRDAGYSSSAPRSGSG